MFDPHTTAEQIRADYSRHVLRAMAGGFKPLTFGDFSRRFARAYYLVGIAATLGE